MKERIQLSVIICMSLLAICSLFLLLFLSSSSKKHTHTSIATTTTKKRKNRINVRQNVHKRTQKKTLLHSYHISAREMQKKNFRAHKLHSFSCLPLRQISCSRSNNNNNNISNRHCCMPSLFSHKASQQRTQNIT